MALTVALVEPDLPAGGSDGSQDGLAGGIDLANRVRSLRHHRGRLRG